MIHARKDYNRIQDPALADPSLITSGSSPIAADEPVFLIRAKDKSAPASVDAWAKINLENGGDPTASAMAFSHAAKMRDWQNKHGAKPADVPDSEFNS